MSVDIYMSATVGKEEHDAALVAADGVLFGAACRICRYNDLFRLENSVIDDGLIETLLSWPRDPVQRPKAVAEFLENNRGKHLKIKLQFSKIKVTWPGRPD